MHEYFSGPMSVPKVAPLGSLTWHTYLMWLSMVVLLKWLHTQDHFPTVVESIFEVDWVWVLYSDEGLRLLESGGDITGAERVDLRDLAIEKGGQEHLGVLQGEEEIFSLGWTSIVYNVL